MFVLHSNLWRATAPPSRLAPSEWPDFLQEWNAKWLTDLTPNCLMGDNENAFIGGFRLWEYLGVLGILTRRTTRGSCGTGCRSSTANALLGPGHVFHPECDLRVSGTRGPRIQPLRRENWTPRC